MDGWSNVQLQQPQQQQQESALLQQANQQGMMPQVMMPQHFQQQQQSVFPQQDMQPQQLLQSLHPAQVAPQQQQQLALPQQEIQQESMPQQLQPQPQLQSLHPAQVAPAAAPAPAAPASGSAAARAAMATASLAGPSKTNLKWDWKILESRVNLVLVGNAILAVTSKVPHTTIRMIEVFHSGKKMKTLEAVATTLSTSANPSIAMRFQGFKTAARPWKVIMLAAYGVRHQELKAEDMGPGDPSEFLRMVDNVMGQEDVFDKMKKDKAQQDAEMERQKGSMEDFQLAGMERVRAREGEPEEMEPDERDHNLRCVPAPVVLVLPVKCPPQSLLACSLCNH